MKWKSSIASIVAVSILTLAAPFTRADSSNRAALEAECAREFDSCARDAYEDYFTCEVGVLFSCSFQLVVNPVAGLACVGLGSAGCMGTTVARQLFCRADYEDCMARAASVCN